MVRGTAKLSVILLWLVTGCTAFKFVYIPCEQGQPMEEWCLTPKNQEDEIGCLTSHLQMWFGKRGLTEEQKRDFKEHVRMHLKQRNPDEKTEELLDNSLNIPKIGEVSDQILSCETVEIVTVLPPISNFGYVTISLYIDDKGVARGLPHNHRATSLLETVSTRVGPVLGDAFVARSYDNEGEHGGFRRMDLGVSEISSSAGWIKVCQQQKLMSLKNQDKVRAQMEDIKSHRDMQTSESDKRKSKLIADEREDEAASVQDESNPLFRDGYAVFPATQSDDAPVSERQCLAIAAELREKGNEFYNSREYNVALRKYIKSRRYAMHSYFVTPDPDDRVSDSERDALLTKTELNLALAAFHIPRVALCEATCRKVLFREPSNIKALYRLGCCQRDYGDMEQARATFAKGCDIAPDDGSMRRALKTCDTKIIKDRRASSQLGDAACACI